MKKHKFASVFVVLIAALLVIPASASARDNQESGRQHQEDRLKVMTYNIYQGTELRDVLTSATPGQLVVAVAKDFGHMVTNNFSERATQIAIEVGASHPDVIGLQEVALWQTTPISKTCPASSGQTINYLQILLAALAADGLDYTTVVVRSNFAVQSPGLFGCGLINVRLTDQSAILIRTSDIDQGDLSISNIQSHSFVHNFGIVFFGSTIVLVGGWASVDIGVGGGTIRFISTHLDGFSQTVRTAQAGELVAGPVNAALPVILSGDLNSVNTDPAFAQLASAGFIDSWLATNPGDLGLTCCQVNQNGVIVDVINNPASTLSQRVDYILTLGNLQSVKMKLVGDDPSSRSASGLWPSDHAGLVATLTGTPGQNAGT